MRRTAELRLVAMTEARSRAAIERQLAQWTDKLERHVTEQFQLRSYVAALRHTGPPNPKVRRTASRPRLTTSFYSDGSESTHRRRTTPLLHAIGYVWRSR